MSRPLVAPLLIPSLLSLGLAVSPLACKGGRGGEGPPRRVAASDRAGPGGLGGRGVEGQSGLHTEIGPQRGAACQLTLCFAGPGSLTDPPNVDLGELCRRAPGVVRRCEGERCRSLWSSESWEQGLEALISGLDSNGDGRVDERDKSCLVAAAGWSTGAELAAREFPTALLADGRISIERAQVDRLVAVAPRSHEGAALELAPNVVKAFIYRYSLAPKGDCSRAYEGGPWISPAPICDPDTSCVDYDYSLEPALAFLSRRGARGGAEVGHCNIMAIVAHTLGHDNLRLGLEGTLEHAPQHPDGSPGGRERPDPRSDEGPPPLPPPELD